MKFLWRRRGFTLVEMLIVIIIIGVLVAALIPRMTSARGRANDTARRAHLQQLGTAVMSYYFDNGKFPDCPASYGSDGPCPTSAISGVLIGAGLSSVPIDPRSDMSFPGLAGKIVTTGDYQYIKIYKNGVKNGWFVLMAATETAGGANWIIDSTTSTNLTGGYISTGTASDFSLINNIVCDGRDTAHTISFTLNDATASLSACRAGQLSNALRYILTY